ncbi:MAG: TolB family protein [Betaproteobacteria bacterium]
MIILAIIAALTLLQSPAQVAAQLASPPDTEIYLAPLTGSGAGLAVGRPQNITHSPGYDNQPFFTPDGRGILFTSIRGGGTLPDVYRYDLAEHRTTRVTDTPEGEYSPTVTPDGRHISVVRVEADKTQRLWQFTLDGREPQLVLPAVKPVGYHAWADDHTLVLFVLGQPATLQVADTRTGKSEIAARDIGRSIAKVPGEAAISFVERRRDAGQAAPALWISTIDPKTGQVTPLVRAVAGAKEADCAWTPDGTLLMAHDDVLYAWRKGAADWVRVGDLGALGLHHVTRLAVSPKGDRIAIVTQ